MEHLSVEQVKVEVESNDSALLQHARPEDANTVDDSSIQEFLVEIGNAAASLPDVKMEAELEKHIEEFESGKSADNHKDETSFALIANTDDSTDSQPQRIKCELYGTPSKTDEDELKYDVDVKPAKDAQASSKPAMGVKQWAFMRHMQKHALDSSPANYFLGKENASLGNGHYLLLKCVVCGLMFSDADGATAHATVHFELVKDAAVVEPEEHFADTAVLVELIEVMKKCHCLSVFGNNTVRCDNDFRREPLLFEPLTVDYVLQCEFCDYLFADIDAMLLHSKCHDPNRRFECSKCDMSFVLSKELLNHLNLDCVAASKQRYLPRRYACNICRQSYVMVDQLQEHRQAKGHIFPRYDAELEKLVAPCNYCELSFCTASEWHGHFEEKHANERRREKCGRVVAASSTAISARHAHLDERSRTLMQLETEAAESVQEQK